MDKAVPFLTAMFLCASVMADGFKDSQAFADIELQRSLSDTWSYFLAHQSKARDEGPAYFLWHIKGGVRYEATRWLRLAAAHRYEEARCDHDWLRESRSTLEGTAKHIRGRWKLSSRNRMEYRDFEGAKPDRWRYRNELRATHMLAAWDLSAYIAEEPQYDFEAERWSKHRMTAGLSRKLASWLKGSVYCRWDVVEQSDNHGAWDTTQIVGIKLVANMSEPRSK